MLKPRAHNYRTYCWEACRKLSRLYNRLWLMFLFCVLWLLAACDGLQKITPRRVIFWRRVVTMLSARLYRFLAGKTYRNTWNIHIIPKFATCILWTILIMQMHKARHLRVENPKRKEEVRWYPNDFLPNVFRLFRSHNYRSPDQQHWLPVVSARHRGRRTNILAAHILFTLNREKNARF